MKKIIFFFLLFFIIISCFFNKFSNILAQEQCMAIAGDSVEYGDVVYEDPSIGSFPVVNTGHVSSFIQKISVKDYSVAASSLTVNNIYSDQQIVNSNCQYIVIGPWVNDLGQGDAQGTVNAINQMVTNVVNKNPNTKILLVNYYSPQPASWASNIWPRGFSSSRISTFNSLISSTFSSNSHITIGKM